jgi:hypothetical protein
VPAEQDPEVEVLPVLQYEEPDSEQKGLGGGVPLAKTIFLIRSALEIKTSSENIIIMAFFIKF